MALKIFRRDIFRCSNWLQLIALKTMPANISGAPLPSATNVTPATSSLNPSKSEILVWKNWNESWIMNHWICCTYKNGHKEGIGSHTKGDKKIHEPNKIRHLDSDDVRVASTVTAVFETRAFVAFDFFIVFVFVDSFIILLQGWDRLKSTKIQESSGATNWSTTFNSPDR